MKVKTVMSRPVVAVTSKDSIRTAATLLRKHNVGALPVLDGTRSIGIVTDRDLVIRVFTELFDPGALTVGDVMSPNPVTCHEDQTVDEAAAIMGEHQIRRLPVVDLFQNLIGMISVGDIAENVSEELAGQTLGEIAEKR